MNTVSPPTILPTKPSFTSNAGFLTVGDLKQFAYCPRIPYFLTFLGLRPPATFLMEHGASAENAFERRQKRHDVRRFELEKGVRRTRVVASSKTLRLAGTIDLVIEAEGELVVVDFKSARKASWRNHEIQIGAYGLLAEERFGKPCRRGYLFYAEDRKWVRIDLTEKLREEVSALIETMRKTAGQGLFPEPTPIAAKCRNCEFLNFCGDRW